MGRRKVRWGLHALLTALIGLSWFQIDVNMRFLLFRTQASRSAADCATPGKRGRELSRAVSHDGSLLRLVGERFGLICMSRHYLQSPYYFMCCSLYDANEDQPVPVPPATALAGTLVSSLHRLKDVDNNGKPAFL